METIEQKLKAARKNEQAILAQLHATQGAICTLEQLLNPPKKAPSDESKGAQDDNDE